MRGSRFSTGRLLIGISLIGLGIAGCGDRQDGVDETKRRGDLIVQALNKYYAVKKQYPATLDDLCPQYLREIPGPTWGLEAWIYEPRKSDFQLQVNETSRTGDGDSYWLRFEGEKWGWQMGD